MLSGQRVAVVALGDLGRCPRMLNHAQCLADAGARVDLVGHRGSAAPSEIEKHERIRIHRLRDPLSHAPALLGSRLLRGIARALVAHAQLLRTLLFEAERPCAIVVQTPPALPTLGVAWTASRLRRARLIVDWHNFGDSLLALRFGARHPVVRAARLYERFWAHRADAHLCVSEAMARALRSRRGVTASVVRDLPTARFSPMESDSRRDAARQWLERHSPTAKWGPRSALIACPTSWSDDDDFDLLLDALAAFDRKLSPGSSPTAPRLHVLLTGRGPHRSRVEAQLAHRTFRHSTVHTAWLPADDYPKLLAAADLGLSVHRSASGVDLPMKVADMFGAGLPVCALDYGPCLAEQIRAGEDGLLFADAAALAGQLYELFVSNPDRLDALRRGAREAGHERWADAWNEVARPLILGAPSATGVPESLRVAFFHPDLGIGGAERWIVDAASSLQAAGHAVSIITSRHDPDRCFDATRDGTLDVRVRGHWLPAHVGQRLRAPCAIARTAAAVVSSALRRERFDVVVVDLVPHVIPLVRRLLGSRIVYYCHYPDQLMTGERRGLYALYRAPIDRLEAAAVGRADRVLANSRFTAEAVERVFPDARTPEVLHPGIDPKLYALAPAAASDRIVVLSISRFDPGKNLELAVAALAGLAERLPDETFARVELRIAGGFDPDWPAAHAALDRVERRARALGVEERVVVDPSPSDASRRELLARCACLVYTPEGEHFGIVPLEAMAAGKPVVAVRSGGPLETVVDGETGRLCAPRGDAFADALAGILLDPERARRMGEAGRARAEEQFGLDRFAGRLVAVVEGLAR